MKIQEFYNQFHVFEQNQLLGLRDLTTDRVIIPPVCRIIYPVTPYYYSDVFYLIVKIGPKYSLYNMSGEKISEEYDYLGEYNRGIIPFAQNFLYGFLNSEGKVFIEPKYSRVERLDGGKFKVKTDNKWGIVSELGEVTPPIYEKIIIGYGEIQGMLNGEFEVIRINSKKD